MAAETPIEPLLRLLDLERRGAECFHGQASGGGRRLFGGLVAAQALVAAGRTIEELRVHSLHAYFLRPGQPGVPIDYQVTALKEGRNFHVRSVTARQGEETIFTLQTGFARPEEGIAHQEPAPEAPPPDDLPDRDRLRGHADWRTRPVEIRSCHGIDGSEPRDLLWMRPRGPLPEDPLIHAAVLVYASDRALLSTASRPHASHGRRRAASLDHSVWLHRPVRFDDWLLFAAESPVAHDARALCLASFWSRDGGRVASIAQEGLVRYAPAARR